MLRFNELIASLNQDHSRRLYSANTLSIDKGNFPNFIAKLSFNAVHFICDELLKANPDMHYFTYRITCTYICKYI